MSWQGLRWCQNTLLISLQTKGSVSEIRFSQSTLDILDQGERIDDYAIAERAETYGNRVDHRVVLVTAGCDVPRVHSICTINEASFKVCQ